VGEERLGLSSTVENLMIEGLIVFLTAKADGVSVPIFQEMWAARWLAPVRI